MSALSPLSDHFSGEQDDDRDYAARLEDVLGGSDGEEQEESDEEGFVYNGADVLDQDEDAEASGPYREQLSEILEQSMDELDELEDEEHIEKILFRETSPAVPAESRTDEPPPSSSTTPKQLPFRRPGFLHPNISRLRSYAAQPRASSTSNAPSANNLGLPVDPSTPSALSRASSTSYVHEREHEDTSVTSSMRNEQASPQQTERLPFRWSTMRSILPHLSAPNQLQATPQKAAALLGNQSELPTVMAANGLICLGTTQGRVYIFDFKQNLRTVCTAKDSPSPVTALALSSDKTFIAVGHLSGQIHLYELSNPSAPARSVPTHTRAAVASGRREGHLHNSRITQINFVGLRHTAIVSADEYGMVFYHSLGKVLFVEASDVLRLLGKYPEENHQEGVVALPSRSVFSTSPSPLPTPTHERANALDNEDGSQSPHSTIRQSSRRLSKQAYQAPWIRQSPHILSMSPLPLGTNVHPTDLYNIIAIMTPVKLVVVALKPTPKTWLRKRRIEDRYAAIADMEDQKPTGVTGCIAWFPSVNIPNEDGEKNGSTGNGGTKDTLPTLAYSWGAHVKLITIKEDLPGHLVQQQQQVLSKSAAGRKGAVPHELGRLVFEDAGEWTAGGNVRAIQWLTPHQVVLVLENTIEVWDIRDGCKLIETARFAISGLVSLTLRDGGRKIRSYEGSFCAYKGKIFLLGTKEIIVGNLLTWTDHILNLVSQSDSLGAIELAVAYHLNTAPGNQNGLPRNLTARQKVTSNQLRELMHASVRHAFSPDRLTDATHRTRDNRGVDRTALFEGLIPTCVHACLALDEMDYLYEEIFESYDSNGIAVMFLRALEPFLLDGTIKDGVPVWITQRLIQMHVEAEEFKAAEALIWHLDPQSLDVDQAISLCRNQELWDAMVYVYTRALKDYVAPVVELLVLVRAVQRYRNGRSLQDAAAEDPNANWDLEKKTMDAYKVFPYIAATLSGLTYPSQTPLPTDDVNMAKGALYGFLVDGRSRIWPEGPNGKLVPTSDEDGGPEPTYPYLRLLLRFDPESMLHTLDLAFEDSYLNDDNQGVGRLIIVKILLEMLNGGTFPEGDATLVRIFVARNVPKYPQYIKMSPALLHSVLVGLAEDEDRETREDRQLAAEYLLSAYKPREEGELINLFEDAGFYRILRTRYRAERQWSLLLEAYLQDEDIPSTELFSHLEEVLTTCSPKKTGTPADVVLVVVDALPRLMEIDISRTAIFVDRRLPEQHTTAVRLLDGGEKEQLDYLRTLLQPSKITSLTFSADEDTMRSPSVHVDRELQQLFFQLLCRTDADDVVEALETTNKGILSYDDLVPIFQRESAHDAVVLALRASNKNEEALEYIETACHSEGGHFVDLFQSPLGASEEKALKLTLHRLQRMLRTGVSLCSTTEKESAPADKRWLRLLQSQIILVQTVVDATGQWSDDLSKEVIDTLRAQTQQSFDALVLHSSSQGISFPQLFKELVTSTTQANKYSSSASSENASKELYSEFRSILTGMLDTYRYEGELLTTTSALLHRDVNAIFVEWSRKLQLGWRASKPVCGKCKRNLVLPTSAASTTTGEDSEERPKITVSASGEMFHVACPA